VGVLIVESSIIVDCVTSVGPSIWDAAAKSSSLPSSSFWGNRTRLRKTVPRIRNAAQTMKIVW
jgi:hypothetical protein